jgi:DNA-directed RNA polymerase subunit RPC12/RpoP
MLWFYFNMTQYKSLKSESYAKNHGMIAITIRGLDIEELVRYLSDMNSNVVRRIWRSEYRVISVFLQEIYMRGTLMETAFLIIVDHDLHKNECNIEATGTAGRIGVFRFPAGSPETVESAFRKDMEEFALNRGWPCESRVVLASYRGTKCPLCGAIYVYSKERIQDDGEVVCQNCGKPFVPSEE